MKKLSVAVLMFALVAASFWLATRHYVFEHEDIAKVSQIAIEKNNIGLCRKIIRLYGEDGALMGSQDFAREECFELFGIGKADPLGCDLLPEARPSKGWCYAKVAGRTGEITICDRILDNLTAATDCVQAVVAATGNTTYCLRIFHPIKRERCLGTHD